MNPKKKTNNRRNIRKKSEFMGGNANEFFEREKDHQMTGNRAKVPTKYCSLSEWRFKDPKLLQKLQQAINDCDHNSAF